jgi:pimeloyl-ACP methyl ester carboxylesterase
LAVAGFGQLQQLLHFFAQLGLDPVGMLPRQGLVLAGVGRDLGAVQRDVAQLQALHLSRQHQHLDEQLLDLRQEAPAEAGNAVVVGLRVRSNEAKRHRVVTGALDLAAGVHASGVAVHQQAQQHRRVVRIAAASGVLADQLAQVQLVDDFDNKARQMILWQPLVHRRRQQVGSVSIYGNEAAHAVGVCLNRRNCPSSRTLRVAGKARQAPRLSEDDPFAYLRGIRQPAFILNGVNDVMIPTVNSFYMARNLPNAQLFIYPDAGHAAQFQYPQRFLRHAVQFLSE